MMSRARTPATTGIIAAIRAATIPMSKPAVVSGSLSLRSRMPVMAADSTDLAIRWDLTIKVLRTTTARRTTKAHPTIRARRMGTVPMIKGHQTMALRLNN